MKDRSSKHGQDQKESEFKGVVKRMTGKLTNNPELEREGCKEMLGEQERTENTARQGNTLDPDPHRRG